MTPDDVDEVQVRICPVCSGPLADGVRVHRDCAPALLALFDDEADG